MAHNRSMVVKDACQHRVQSSALGQGRRERRAAKSAFKAVRSMARIFRVMTYVGREGGTAMLRWQMTQAWSEAME